MRKELDPIIIGFTGKAGSGKDEACKQLFNMKEGLGFVNHLAFAQRIKRIGWMITGWTDEWLADNKENVDPKFGFSPRELYQMIGTEFGRNLLGDDIWIKGIQKDIENNKHETIAITDVRFNNEAEYIKSIGGVIVEVYRDEVKEVKDHVSEDGIDESYIDFKIENNGTIDDLTKAVGDTWSKICLLKARDEQGRKIPEQHENRED